MSDARLLLDLDGRVALTDADGRDVTPSGRKARGLLVALGLAPGMRLSRQALRALLWSDRSEEQAGASLRRLVADLRALDEALANAFTSGPSAVGLVGVAVRQPPAGAPDRLAAGLELRDPAFAGWLALRRAPRDAPPADAPVLEVILQPDGSGGHPICDAVLHDAARRAARLRPLLLREFGKGAPSAALKLRCVAIPDGAGGLVLEASVTRGDGVVLASQMVAAGAGGLVAVCGALSDEVTRALLGPVAGLLDDITSYDPVRIDGAMRRLSSEESGLRPRVAPALRAFGHLATWLDRFEGGDAREEARALVLEALSAAPGEPVVNAAATLVLANAGDAALALPLAERAVRDDPRGGLARYAAATAHAHLGGIGPARTHAELVAGQALPGLSEAMAAMGAAMACARAGAEAEALDWARRAWLLAPTSRPAMRFVAALAYRAGDEAMAAQALRSLEVAEPGFSAAAMAEPDYPVATLRAAGLLDVAWARHLGGARRDLAARRRGGR